MKSFAIRSLALAAATLLSTPAQAVSTFTGQPLSLLFYGPYAGLEFGDRTSFALRGRLGNSESLPRTTTTPTKTRPSCWISGSMRASAITSRGASEAH